MFHQNARGLLGNHLHVSALLQSFPGIDILSLSEPHIVVGNEHEEGVTYISDYSYRSPKAFW